MKIIIEVLKRILGMFFCFCLTIAGLMLFLIGITLCSTLIGIIVGLPIIYYGFVLTIAAIICGFQMTILGKINTAPFKKLQNYMNKIIQKQNDDIVAEVSPEKFNITNAKFVSLSPAVEKFELN
jgi:vacuolar-type H+-ATPase subunit I/STV1